MIDNRNEKLYYISLCIAKSMLKQNIISKQGFCALQTELLEKYRPVSALLMLGKDLTL